MLSQLPRASSLVTLLTFSWRSHRSEKECMPVLASVGLPEFQAHQRLTPHLASKAPEALSHSHSHSMSAWGSAALQPPPAQTSLQALMDEALALKLYEDECRAFEKELNPEYFAQAAAFGSGRDVDQSERFNADSELVQEQEQEQATTAAELARERVLRAMGGPSGKTAHSGGSTGAKQQKTRRFDRELAIDDLKGVGKGFTALRESQRRALKSEKNGVAGGRVEAEQFSTSEGVLDERTTRILQKMINRGELDEVHGVVRTGKEAHVFHAVGLGRVPEADEDWAQAQPIELAVKVFKTTLNEFSNRHEYVTGDRRFDMHFQKKDMRRQMKHWTEKEFRNLCRAAKCGIKAPKPFAFREHVLLMEFIGEGDGWPAPTLKDLTLTPNQQAHFYADIIQANRTLYQVAHLVHGDLSEYNILVHEGRTWLIDFGQAVDRSHPETETYLRRDLRTLHRFFERAGLPEASDEEVGLLPDDLAVEFITAEGNRRAYELLDEFAPLRDLLREKQPENVGAIEEEEEEEVADDSEEEEEEVESTNKATNEKSESSTPVAATPTKPALPVA